MPAFDDEEPVPDPEMVKPLLEVIAVAQALNEVDPGFEGDNET